MNLQITINEETYKITDLIAELKEAQHDMRLMSEELERNETIIADLKKENARLRNINQNLELEKIDLTDESVATRDYIEDLLLENEKLQYTLSQIRILTQ